MCGIVGILDPSGSPPERELVCAIESLRERGPDHQATVALPHIALGHTRLAIIDLNPASNQPMADGSGQVWIVFNGEIYNYMEVRRELQSRGVVFRTRSDTEVLLEAYKAWGKACVGRLNGMFALAIWDQLHRRLFLARDRLGEKPLYYGRDQAGRFIFASNLNALRTIQGAPSKVDPRAINQFLSIGYVLGERCIIDGVKRLPPAHRLTLDWDGRCEVEPYWNLAEGFHRKNRFASEPEAAEALGALIDDSVRLRLVGDVPLGVFLSGGIDSAVVAGAMSRHMGRGELRTFTIDFDHKDFSEAARARLTATHLGTKHTEELVDIGEAERILPAVMAKVGEPFADTSIIPTYYVARLARRDTAFCLSGDGADEIFAGYETYKADRIQRLTSWLPRWSTGLAAATVERLVPHSYGKVSLDYKLRHFLKGHALPPIDAHYSWRVLFDDGGRSRLAGSAGAWGEGDDALDVFRREAQAVADCHYLDRAMYVDLKTWLVDDILVKVDRASMANSLEVRAPFLDHRLVEFAAGLPVEMKMRGFTGKYLLRKSQRANLPSVTLHGRKQGFNAPLAQWFLGRLGDLARAATTTGPITSWIDVRHVAALWDEHRARRKDNSFRLFALTSLGLWLAGAK